MLLKQFLRFLDIYLKDIDYLKLFRISKIVKYQKFVLFKATKNCQEQV